MRRRSLAVWIAGAALGCPAPDLLPARPGPACTALLDLATRAATCDPPLADIAERVRTAPDERACRLAARALLAAPSDARATTAVGVRSVYAPAPAVDDTALSDAELGALAELLLPAHLVVTPDLVAIPGLPPTRATVDEIPLATDAHGRLRIATAPGARTLRVHHAGRQAEYCIELEACTTVELTSHGARVARDPRVHAGACSAG